MADWTAETMGPQDGWVFKGTTQEAMHLFRKS